MRRKERNEIYAESNMETYMTICKISSVQWLSHVRLFETP